MNRWHWTWRLRTFWLKLTGCCTQCGVKHLDHKMDCSYRYNHMAN